MSIMDNFKQAAKELFGVGDGGEQPHEDGTVLAEAVVPDAAAAPEQDDRPLAEGNLMSAFDAGDGSSHDETEPAEDTTPFDGNVTVTPQRNTSYIAKGMVISGRVRTDGNIELFGRVDGSVDAEGDVVVAGDVLGNVSGNQLGLYDCRVKGDLRAVAGIAVNLNSIIVGNVNSERIVLDGKLKGDIRAKQTAVLKKGAYLLGDLTAESLSVETGAVLNGNVTTLLEHDKERPFDDMWPNV